MRRILKQCIISLFIYFVHIFIASLLPPFNLLEIINITLVLVFLFWGLDTSIIIALLLGILKDHSQGTTLGITSLIFFIALIALQVTRDTLLTHQNRASVLLLSLLFNIIYFISLILEKFKYNLIILQEITVKLMINATLTFLAFIFIKWIQDQFKKRFI